MSDVTKIKLPDNSELNIKDYRIPGVDSTPTSGSNNVVTSGGIHTAMADTELVVATALNDLNDRVSDLEDGAETLESDSVWEAGTGTNSVIVKGSLGTAGGNYSTVEGKGSVTGGTHTEYDLTPDTSDSSAGSYAHAEGRYTIACGKNGAHAEGDRTLASGSQAHAEGGITIASGNYSHAEGALTSALKAGSHAEGIYSVASGLYSHAEGYNNVSEGNRSHAEGSFVKASGYISHSEGYHSVSVGTASHAEGNSIAYGQTSHSESGNTGSVIKPIADANVTSYTIPRSQIDFFRDVLDDTVFINILKASVISLRSADDLPIKITNAVINNDNVVLTTEKTLSTTALSGNTEFVISSSIAYGVASHSENGGNVAYGETSHSEGVFTIALGDQSHTEGKYTVTKNVSEHAEGSFNVSNKVSDTYGNAGNTQHSIGIGNSTTRKNAVEVMQNGDVYINGIGGYGGTTIVNANTLQDVIAEKAEFDLNNNTLYGGPNGTMSICGYDGLIYALGSDNADGTEDLVLATTNDIPDAVTANPTVPSGTTPTALTGLKVGSGYYSISSGGSGGSGGISEKTYAIPFGHVDSTSTSTVFTATVDNFPSTLSDGVCAYIYNGVVSSASGCTLNINNTGAKPIYSTMELETAVTTTFNINYTMLFVYNSTRVSGGCWDMFYGYYSSTQYRMRTNSTSKPVSGATYRYRLLFSSADDTQWVPANTSTSTGATASRAVNQTPINPFGPIVYYASTTALSAGENPSTSYQYQQYNITLGYSFNRTGAALTLTNRSPVYIKCAPQSDGSAIIDADTPYVQTLPSTEDGKIYIYLGQATSATAVELVINHPVYCYKNGAIRLWTNALSSGNYLPLSGGEMDDAASITVSRRHGNGPEDTIVIGGSNIDFTGYEETGMRLDCANSKLIISNTAPSIWTNATPRTEYGFSNISKWASSSTTYTYTFPNKTGTFAMTSDIPDVSGKQDTIVDNGVLVGVNSGGIRAIKTTNNKIYALNSLVTTIEDDNVLATLGDIPTISTNIASDKANNNKVSGTKATYDAIHPAVVSTQPAGGMLPNILYDLGTVTGTVTFTIASPTDATIINHYYWTFETSSTAPTITWPAGITSWFGGNAPTISASKHYEISVLDGVGCFMEV